MAVFTSVTLADLRPWLAAHDLGQPIACQGIASGIENSNFFLTVVQQGQIKEWVLTLFEKLPANELLYYLQLMRHLAHQGLCVPEPITTPQGIFLQPLRGKPAALVTKLFGQSEMAPTAWHCAQVGHLLAHLHLAGRHFSKQQSNPRGLAWCKDNMSQVLPFLSPTAQALLSDEIQFQTHFSNSQVYQNLQQAPLAGPIHGDLFRDNVMFTHNQISGVIDFYFAGDDLWLLDVAIAVNDWCLHRDISQSQDCSGQFDEMLVRALLDAYHAQRPFIKIEKIAWHPLLRAAALRFWLSRLIDFHLPRCAHTLIPHNPQHFETILRQWREHKIPLLF